MEAKQHARLRSAFRTFVLLVAAVLLVSSAPPVAAETGCTGHTDNDNWECSKDGDADYDKIPDCKKNHRLKVYMSLDDKSETGDATTTCDIANAACAVSEAKKSCEAVSAAWTNAAGSWTCYFEAHDVWWQPDNGFTYSCSSYEVDPATGEPPVDFHLMTAAVSPRCDVTTLEAAMQDSLLTDLCLGLGERETEPHETARIVVRQQGDVVVSVMCDVDGLCGQVDAGCHERGGRLLCGVGIADHS